MLNLSTKPKIFSETENVSEGNGKEHDRRYEERSHKIRKNTIHYQGGRYYKGSKIVGMNINRTYDKRQ